MGNDTYIVDLEDVSMTGRFQDLGRVGLEVTVAPSKKKATSNVVVRSLELNESSTFPGVIINRLEDTPLGIEGRVTLIPRIEDEKKRYKGPNDKGSESAYIYGIAAEIAASREGPNGRGDDYILEAERYLDILRENEKRRAEERNR